jgi:hypothetical protein
MSRFGALLTAAGLGGLIGWSVYELADWRRQAKEAQGMCHETRMIQGREEVQRTQVLLAKAKQAFTGDPDSVRKTLDELEVALTRISKVLT